MNEQDHIARTPVDQHILQLLNSSIDCEINVVDEEELDHLLTASQSVRELNDELRAVTRVLDELPEIAPPQYLQDTIERQVRLPVQNNGANEKPGYFGSWLNANWLRTGFALAAGVVLTVGVYEMGSGPIPVSDSTSMSGTIASNGVTSQQGELQDRIYLESEVLSGQVELRTNKDLFTLNVQLESAGPSELVINLAGRGLEFDSADIQQDTADTISVVDGSIHLASNGEQHYVLNLRRVPGANYPESLELEFFANKQLIQQNELSISQ
jgi:hypothetical protein